MRLTEAIEEETAAREELTELEAAAAFEVILLIIEEALDLISDSLLEKLADNEDKFSPVAVALTEDKESNAAESEASADACAEDADAAAL